VDTEIQLCYDIFIMVTVASVGLRACCQTNGLDAVQTAIEKCARIECKKVTRQSYFTVSAVDVTS